MSYANLGLSIIGMLVAAGFTQFIINSAMTMRVLRLVGVRQEILPRHAFRLAFTNAITNPKPLPFFGTVLPLFLPTPGVVPGRHVDACSHVHVDLVYFAERLRI
jgi:threonine/homoserine/homoserine lactone efflux protein